MSAHRCLVIGGARSGKSSWAERRLAEEPTRYVATGYGAGDDPQWQARLARHRARRPATWQTVETLDVVGHLALDDPRPVLVDCVTLWLTRVCDEAGVWESGNGELVGPAVQALVAAVATGRAEVILVTNEVGSGVVPDSSAGRLFADLLGETNAALAAVCDEVVLMVAGIPVPVKGDAPKWRRD